MHWNRIVERDVEGVTVLDVWGVVTLSEDPGRLFARISQLVDQKHARILVNLAETPYIDSDGLGEMVNGFKAAQGAGGMLKLCGVAPRIRNLLRITRLIGVLEVFESEKDAVASFHPPA